MLDSRRWWLVQTGGALFRSTDAGAGWTAVGPLLPGDLSLAAVRFFDQRTAVGLALSQASRFQRSLVASSDGGAHWRVVSLPHV